MNISRGTGGSLNSNGCFPTSHFDKSRLSSNTQDKKIVKIPTNCFKTERRRSLLLVRQAVVKSEEMGNGNCYKRACRWNIMVFWSVLSQHWMSRMFGGGSLTRWRDVTTALLLFVTLSQCLSNSHESSDILDTVKSILSIGENKSFRVTMKGRAHQKQMPANDDNSKSENTFHLMNGITHKKPIVKIS